METELPIARPRSSSWNVTYWIQVIVRPRIRECERMTIEFNDADRSNNRILTKFPSVYNEK